MQGPTGASHRQAQLNTQSALLTCVELDAAAAIVNMDSFVDKLAPGTEMKAIAPAKLKIDVDQSNFPHEISEHHALRYYDIV